MSRQKVRGRSVLREEGFVEKEGEKLRRKRLTKKKKKEHFDKNEKKVEEKRMDDKNSANREKEVKPDRLLVLIERGKRCALNLQRKGEKAHQRRKQ